MLVLAGAAGTWLFYVQHQFDGVYWERSVAWDSTTAALHGSSYYKLPTSASVFWQHRLSSHPPFESRIPNYHLRKCHNAGPVFRQVKPVTLLSSRLWYEQRKRLVGTRSFPDCGGVAMPLHDAGLIDSASMRLARSAATQHKAMCSHDESAA